jgi:hypothetical protein
MKTLIGPAFFGVPRAYAACEAIARNSDEPYYCPSTNGVEGFYFFMIVRN